MGLQTVFLRFCILVIALLIGAGAPVIAMRVAMAPYLFTDTEGLPAADAVLVPGASVIRGAPSPVLALRADMGAVLYKQQRVDKILVTGDNAARDYDEVTPVRKYLMAAGIPESDIVLDRSGFDTFSSMYRAKTVYGATSIIIVTQDFHLPRAVFLARALGIDAYGFATSQGGSTFDYIREIPASWKALIDIIVHRHIDLETPSQQQALHLVLGSGMMPR